MTKRKPVYIIHPTGEPQSFDFTYSWDHESLERSLNQGAKEVTKKKFEEATKKWMRKKLRQAGVKPGATVYVRLVSAAKSGMSRRIRLLTAPKAGEIRDITYMAATLMGDRLRDGDLVMGGCGMDMGFAAVYDLGRCMWPKGTSKPHGTRNGEPDTNGGYALKHQWL